MKATEKHDMAMLRRHSAMMTARIISNRNPKKSTDMKTLLLYIGGVKCRFSQGTMIMLTPAPNHQEWFRTNRDEITHYKELTA
jgi:hypothetical protein